MTDKHTPEPTDIHSPYNACMYRGHCKTIEKQRDELLADVERCYKMLLSEPDTQVALFKAENILREAIASVKSACVSRPDESETQSGLPITDETQVPAIVFYPAGSLGEEA